MISMDFIVLGIVLVIASHFFGAKKALLNGMLFGAVTAIITTLIIYFL